MQRPIPVVSLIARQRDLTELVGAIVPGAQRLAFDDKLAFHEGRFQRIELSTTDLPEIASHRLLEPRDETARQAIERAFEQSLQGNESLQRVLLGEEHTLGEFRKVYPFSPALVDTLVAASSMLQRDRTALRAMLLLLVDRRESLQVGEIIPLGDLYDVISKGTEAITPAFAEQFRNARQLYDQKLVPMLEREHGKSSSEIAGLPADAPERIRWRNDDRLLKTLLLSSLVGGVRVLQDLTVERLAALNHGSIRTPIPGQEAQVALAKLKKWSSETPEIRIQGDPLNPQVSLAITGIDIEGVLRNADTADNFGNRVGLLKKLVFGELGVEAGSGETHFQFEWRGTRRSTDVVFGNVSDMPLSSLENERETWRVIIDYPIDEAAGGANRDQAKISEFLATGRSARTLIWSPAFFNQQARNELGRLVRLEHALRSDQNFEQCSNHLNASERQQAKVLLQSQRETLRHRMGALLAAAYGLSNDMTALSGLDGTVEVDETFVSLEPGLSLQPPGHGTLSGGLEGLLEQALRFQYPEAPRWARRFTGPQLRKALQIALRAATSHPQRAEVESNDARLMREFAVPLQLGECQSAFHLGDFWINHFNRQGAQAGVSSPTVSMLREWMDQPKRRGLPSEVQDLLVLVYAAQSERALHRHGGALGEVGFGELRGDDELVSTPLPSEANWKAACQRAAEIFGETGNLYLTGANVNGLSQRIQGHVQAARADAEKLLDGLKAHVPSEVFSASKRCRDAEGTLDLFATLETEDPKDLIERLAAFTIAAPCTPTSLGASWKQAAVVVKSLENANWTLLDALRTHQEPTQVQAAAMLLEDLDKALTEQQYVTRLEQVLPKLEVRATAILVKKGDVSQPPTFHGQRWVQAKEDLGDVVKDITETWGDRRGRLSVEWRFEEEP